MNNIKELKGFIEKAVTPFHAVIAVEDNLKEKGFEELKLSGKWSVLCGKRYYVKVYDSSIVAFTVGENGIDGGNLRICSAHTDFPCFKLKPQASVKDSGYHKINIEVYGGPILNTWLDRPLSIAGKITLRGNDVFGLEHRFIDFKRPVITIPNLAIHMNREINKGIELNKQKELLPVADAISDNVGKLDILERIAQMESISIEDIIDYELYIYQTEKGECVGLDSSMFSAPRLDNMTSVKAAMDAITESDRANGINMVAFFDNEEIGSRTKQGAASNILSLIIEKLLISFGMNRQQYIDLILNGFMISADVAHGMHPNYQEKSDIVNKPLLNNGTVIKISANQSYANDADGISTIKLLAEKSGTRCQTFVNRSDMIGGSTLGAITSTVLPMRTIDIGVPILAMHSARELMGVEDQHDITELIKAFFTVQS